MSRELTPWFPGDVKPVRVGVYMTTTSKFDHFHSYLFNYWDGSKWLVPATDANGAKRMDWVAYVQDLKWRGLTKEAK